MSAMQVKNSLKHDEQTYLAALIEIKSDVVQDVPYEVVELLEEFKDVFPLERLRIYPHSGPLIMQLGWSLGHGHPNKPLIACLLRSWRS
ncbi:UNVERIFIED_CONTAM: hypothetical protein Slati_3046200 [Sesamum latifolium]|uniref:Uncharacterized protein n=1 Tax=Sesamum latifolium TaxID=2727402 RepID=A0AAW2UTC9_9LAMI